MLWLVVEPYPSEKYESQIGSSSQLLGEKKTCSKPPTSAKILECLANCLDLAGFILLIQFLIFSVNQAVWYLDPHIPDRKIITFGSLGAVFSPHLFRVNPLGLLHLGWGVVPPVWWLQPWQQKKTHRENTPANGWSHRQ
jgi:hypothetical protein